MTVDYGPVRAVEEFTGWVGNGEVVALLGSNGSGKSTILRAVSGIVPMAAGRVAFCGHWIQGMKPSRIVRLGLIQIPQGRLVFPDQSVEANMLLGAHSRGRPDRSVRDDIAELFDRFPRLAERRRQPAGTLSGGEQQMLAIARGLMARPRMLMLDEPSLGLAPIIQQQLFETLRSLADMGLGILVVEQLAHLALTIADRGYVLDRGQLVAWGTPDELRSSGRLVEAYLGSDRT
ncbi:MAG: ABC transporter ATP-binding protein [Acidimicrobiia bacterium]|nr:ABC transporter ATP-binding protein [Acidimicrobiia bacterium]